MSPRSRPEDIEYRIRLKYASEFNYVTKEHSRDDVSVENYWHNISQRYLMAGDLIYVHVMHKDGSSSKCVFEVTSIDDKTTIVDQIVDWRSCGHKPARRRKAKVEDQAA